MAVLGPTNTGKTHLAVERMLGHASGMIGLPLRLLAREIYDRIVRLRGARSVALITGEEKIVPPGAAYFVCTVEAMPLNREVEFLGVDEIQLCADPSRGHIFTHRLLHARGKHETMFMGASAMGPLIRRLLPEAEFVTRDRFSKLTYAGSKKLTRLPRRSAVVAFSADSVYAIAELIRRQRGGAAVVMGSLSPRTRNAQVALYQSGEVDFLVATDAIGMGLNMDVDHVAFAGLRKFDGKRTRWLTPPEVGQIAGRAGRYRTDGTFGVTGEAPEMDEDLVSSVEEHRFEPLPAIEWRSANLDFNSLKGLIHSLAKPPMEEGLKLASEALDEVTLKQLAGEPEIERAAKDRIKLKRLWEVAQTPDFRKTTLDEHVRLTRTLFDYLTTGGRRIPEDWIASQYAALDKQGGEIETLAQRLSGIRTLAYIAARPDWLRDPVAWQGKTRLLEDRLSDTLHEKLMARFVDRRTSALMKALNVHEEVMAGVAEDGAVTVEGHFVGRLNGVAFEPARGASALEDKALRGAAQAAVAPEVSRRLGTLAGDGDEAFALSPDGLVLWQGGPAGRLAPGSKPFDPKVRLLGELGAAPVRERAARRLEAFLAAEAGRRLAPLKRLQDALSGGSVKGLSRGVAYRVAEAGGIIDRAEIAGEVAALSQAERRTLRELGLRFGAHSLFLPALLKPAARMHLMAFAAVDAPHWRPAPGQPLRLPDPPPSPQVLAAHGLRVAGRWAVPVEALEQLDGLMREAPRQNGGAVVTEGTLAPLGWDAATTAEILRGLGYLSSRAKPGEPVIWRRRGGATPKPKTGPTIRPDSPFAALAALTVPPPAPARRKRKRPRKPRPAAGAA